MLVTARRPEAVQDLVDAHPGPRRRAPRSTSPTAPRSTPRSPRPHAAFGGVDVLVNNAGYGYLSAVEEGDDAEVRALFDTNFFGAVDMIKAVLPGMRAQGARPHRQRELDDRASSPTRRTPTTRAPSTRSRRSPRAWPRRSDRSGSRCAPSSPAPSRPTTSPARCTRPTASRTTPTSTERKELIKAFGEHLPGDPAKLAAAVLQLVGMDDPPLRLLLGQDVLDAFREKTAAWTATRRRVGARHHRGELRLIAAGSLDRAGCRP